MITAIWSPKAKAQLAECLEWISKESRSAGTKTIHDVFRAISTISEFPEIGKYFRLDNTARVYMVGRKYRIFYRIETERIIIDYFQSVKQKTPENP